MEIIQIMIAAGVFIVILLVQSKNSKAKANRKEPSVPRQAQENFPFPTILDDQKSIDEWLGRRSQNEDTPIKTTSKIKKQSQIMGDKMAVSSFPSDINNQKKTTREVEEFEFDAEKAVIYSEILSPKYIEY